MRNDIYTALPLEWHINSICNYKCRYCFSVWPSKYGKTMAIEKAKEQFGMMYRYFKEKYNNTSVKCSIAGGEPMLYKYLDTIIDLLNDIGYGVAITTNGHYLNRNFIYRNMGKIAKLSVSIDSFVKSTNLKMGRCSTHGLTVDIEQLKDLCFFYKSINGNKGVLKINTVINRHNFNEHMSDNIEEFNPDYWKVSRVFPNIVQDCGISNNEVSEFFSKNKTSVKYVYEDIHHKTGGFIMLTPSGHAFNNINSLTESVYRYSSDITDEASFEKALSESGFDHSVFVKRKMNINVFN